MRDQRGVVGGRGVPAGVRVDADAGQAGHVGVDRGECAEQGVADQDVVDQFLLAFEDPGEPLLGWEFRGKGPQPPGVALVGMVESTGVELRPGRPCSS